MTLFQAMILGALQGVTELFPISSLGHSIVLPPLLGWRFDENEPSFLVFLVATHFATALVLFFFYWQDWLKILAGMWRSLRDRQISERNVHGKLGWLLLVSTIPAGILGLLFEKNFQVLFATPSFAALFLICNGALLFCVERLRRRSPSVEVPDENRLANLSWGQAIGVGFMQSLALLPGFSRTGASLAGGLLSGLSHEDAAHYAFLLATPIIAAAAVLKLPELIVDTAAVVPTLVGALCAALGAYLSVRLLTKYFKTRTLAPFALYCLLIGMIAALFAH